MESTNISDLKYEPIINTDLDDEYCIGEFHYNNKAYLSKITEAGRESYYEISISATDNSQISYIPVNSEVLNKKFSILLNSSSINGSKLKKLKKFRFTDEIQELSTLENLFLKDIDLNDFLKEPMPSEDFAFHKTLISAVNTLRKSKRDFELDRLLYLLRGRYKLVFSNAYGAAIGGNTLLYNKDLLCNYSHALIHELIHLYSSHYEPNGDYKIGFEDPRTGLGLALTEGLTESYASKISNNTPESYIGYVAIARSLEILHHTLVKHDSIKLNSDSSKYNNDTNAFENAFFNADNSILSDLMPNGSNLKMNLLLQSLDAALNLDFNGVSNNCFNYSALYAMDIIFENLTNLVLNNEITEITELCNIVDEIQYQFNTLEFVESYPNPSYNSIFNGKYDELLNLFDKHKTLNKKDESQTQNYESDLIVDSELKFKYDNQSPTTPTFNYAGRTYSIIDYYDDPKIVCKIGERYLIASPFLREKLNEALGLEIDLHTSKKAFKSKTFKSNLTFKDLSEADSEVIDKIPISFTEECHELLAQVTYNNPHGIKAKNENENENEDEAKEKSESDNYDEQELEIRKEKIKQYVINELKNSWNYYKENYPELNASFLLNNLKTLNINITSDLYQVANYDISTNELNISLSALNQTFDLALKHEFGHILSTNFTVNENSKVTRAISGFGNYKRLGDNAGFDEGFTDYISGISQSHNYNSGYYLNSLAVYELLLAAGKNFSRAYSYGETEKFMNSTLKPNELESAAANLTLFTNYATYLNNLDTTSSGIILTNTSFTANLIYSMSEIFFASIIDSYENDQSENNINELIEKLDIFESLIKETAASHMQYGLNPAEVNIEEIENAINYYMTCQDNILELLLNNKELTIENFEAEA